MNYPLRYTNCFPFDLFYGFLCIEPVIIQRMDEPFSFLRPYGVGACSGRAVGTGVGLCPGCVQSSRGVRLLQEPLPGLVVQDSRLFQFPVKLLGIHAERLGYLRRGLRVHALQGLVVILHLRG